MLTLANTREVLSIVNRPGNRPSHEGGGALVDQALAVCFRGGFRRALSVLRGDTEFSQSEHFGPLGRRCACILSSASRRLTNLKAIAADLTARASWRPLQRPARCGVKTSPRPAADKVKEAVVVAREFENKRLRSEEVAEFNYRPTACRKTYRMVVVKKNISVEKGEKLLFDQIVYFFYISNDWVSEADEIVFSANDRCDQENVLAQLGGGVRALRDQ